MPGEIVVKFLFKKIIMSKMTFKRVSICNVPKWNATFQIVRNLNVKIFFQFLFI